MALNLKVDMSPPYLVFAAFLLCGFLVSHLPLNSSETETIYERAVDVRALDAFLRDDRLSVQEVHQLKKDARWEEKGRSLPPIALLI